MYSTKLQSDSLIYIVRCKVNSNGPKFVDFVVDTGAKYTCASYLSIDLSIVQNDFDDAECKYLGGIVAGYVIKV